MYSAHIGYYDQDDIFVARMPRVAAQMCSGNSFSDSCYFVVLVLYLLLFNRLCKSDMVDTSCALTNTSRSSRVGVRYYPKQHPHSQVSLIQPCTPRFCCNSAHSRASIPL